MMKYVWAVLGGGAALFWLVIFWPALDEAQNATESNISASVGNYTGLAAGIDFSQLLLWLGIVSLPLIVIAVYAWRRRMERGGY